MKLVSVVLVMLSLSACKPSGSGSDPSPEPAAESPVEKPADDKPAAVEATKRVAADAFQPVTLPGTPHDEEHVSVALTWAAGAGKVEFADQVRGTPSVTVDLTKGDKLEYSESVMFITEGTVLTPTKDDVMLRGASAYSPDTDSLAEGSRDEPVTASDKVWMLKYAGEGTCFIQKNDQVFLAGCPNDEFKPADRAPATSEWWVNVTSKAGSGWLLVDDRIDVKTSSSM